MIAPTRSRACGGIVCSVADSRPLRDSVRAVWSSKETLMGKWVKPSFRDLRLGFEITLYINNR